jgi:RNA polymerase sigma factor (sigma-70 family)
MPSTEPTLLTHIRRMAAPGGESLTDAELLGRYAEHRDAAAFEVLVWRHGPMVWATCHRILGHRHDVEDAFQATFLALARAAGTLGSRQAVGGWLHRVAVNAALKLKADRIATGITIEMPARTEADGGEFAGVVDEELSRLPERSRTAFVLCCLEGMTSAEAARELGCPVGTVDSRLHAARSRLRERLTRRGFAPGVLAGLAAVTVPPAASVAAAVRIGSGAAPAAAVAALATQVTRIVAGGTRAMKAVITVTLVVAFAGVLWAFGGSQDVPPAAPTGAAPVPRADARGEGRIALWREGHPIAFTPGVKGTTSPDGGFEGKRGALRLGPDGKLLIYVMNRSTMRPTEPDKRDRLYIRDGKENTEIDPGVSLCHAFWGTDGMVYGYGLALPKDDAEAPVDLTADLVNWSFDPRTGKADALKLPGNVSILDRSPDGKAFLVLRYEKTPTAPGTSADYRLGLLPAAGGDLIPLGKAGEFTPGDFRFSPDGHFALGIMYRQDGNDSFPELTVIDLRNGKRTAVAVAKDVRVCASCWSPDGRRVAYVWGSQAAHAERYRDREGPVVPGWERKPTYTVTVAKPDGSDAKDVYTASEYHFGSIDWRANTVPARQPPAAPAKPKEEKPDDEAAAAAHIKALRDPDGEKRAAAAEALRRIVAKYPSGTVYLTKKDGGEAAWQEQLDRVGPGMKKAEVLKILPPFAEAPESSEIGSGDSHIAMYRLDYHWVVTVRYRNPDKVIDRPTLARRALRIYVEPPKNFTGTWLTWHVNGQKGYEIQFKDGKYDGTFTTYHDNGGKSYEQHYVNHVIHGADTGWFPDGRTSYTAEYKNGKKEGTWTHWYANSIKHSETTYSNDQYHGRDSRWHENGQLAAVNDYKNGVKHGREAAWDENGILQYDRTFVDGKLVE